MSTSLTELWTAAAALAAVLGLIWLSQVVVRRSGRLGRSPAGQGRLGVVQSLALDPRRRVVLLRCDGRHLLLLTGGSQDVMLGFLPGQDAP